MPIFSNVPKHEGRTITLHSTWVGIVMSYAGAAMFVGFSLLLLLDIGANVITVAMMVVSSVFAVIALLDLPIAAEFRSDGVIRRTALRHQFIEWDRVDRLRRLRVGIMRTKSDSRGGGLVAKMGKRRYMLVDTMESALEFDDLIRVMGEWADALGLNDATKPPDGRSPTWLYRRDRWKPESARSR